MSASDDKNTETPVEQLHDDDLWETFQEDFKEWRLKDFKVVQNQFIIALRNQLRCRGVLVQKGRGYPIARRLYDTVYQKDPLIWTEEEIKEQLISDTTNFDSYIYEKVNLTEDIRIKGLPIMLKGDAKEFYYQSLFPHINNLTNFDEIVNKIKSNFEGAEYQHKILENWQDITLDSFTLESSEKLLTYY
ncbi:hypothetical protein EPUL_003736 [Erysiphe pulchra]|uniref:Uncharacterized protein n=1 Tax=Erysiphe pulchra TaxID=225359 RepID=A0A2S4PM07_9PEZI|nr:hypothetical protein EPUL_003736 [Erysiphe pulchra]